MINSLLEKLFGLHSQKNNLSAYSIAQIGSFLRSARFTQTAKEPLIIETNVKCSGSVKFSR